MNEAELQRIRYDILNFLQDVKTKVSIFLRQGQQNIDGTFAISNNYSLPYGMYRIMYYLNIKQMV